MARVTAQVARFESHDRGAESVSGSKDKLSHAFRRNVSRPERWLTGMGALGLAGYGWKKGGAAGAWMVLGAGGLLLRATTGYCPVYATTGHGTLRRDWEPSSETPTKRELSAKGGIPVQATITIDRPLSDVYAFWRNLENLPRFMKHLESVSTIDRQRSHWVARGPAGSKVEWDAEIIHEEPDKVIGWQSVGDADVVNAGSVKFDAATSGGGTEVRVNLQYAPPAGKLGAAVAGLLGEEPSQQIREDLQRLKQMLEL